MQDNKVQLFQSNCTETNAETADILQFQPERHALNTITILHCNKVQLWESKSAERRAERAD